VKDALAEEAREDSPPNVVIEPENKKASKSMD